MKTTKLTKLKFRLIAYSVLSFAASVLPIALVIAINWGRYTGYTVGGTVKLGAGALIGVTFIALKIIGKLKMPYNPASAI